MLWKMRKRRRKIFEKAEDIVLLSFHLLDHSFFFLLSVLRLMLDLREKERVYSTSLPFPYSLIG